MSNKSLRLTILIICIGLAILIFNMPSVNSFFGTLDQIGYLAALAAGMFFAFGYTLPFSAGIFITMHPQQVWIAALLGVLGCLISNFFIYHFMKQSFMEKFDKLRRVVVLRDFHNSFETNKMQRYLIYLGCSFYGLLLALPVSDRFEDKIVTGMREIDSFYLATIGFVINLLLIFIFLML